MCKTRKFEARGPRKNEYSRTLKPLDRMSLKDDADDSDSYVFGLKTTTQRKVQISSINKLPKNRRQNQWNISEHFSRHRRMYQCR